MTPPHDARKCGAVTLVRVCYVGVGFVLGLLLLVFRFDRQTGLTELIRFGDQWADRRLPELSGLSYAEIKHHGGYDGQFYAQLAIRPCVHDPEWQATQDAASYRARRILMPLIAHWAGLGNPAWILQIFALINPISWLAFAALLCRWLPPNSWENFARWFCSVCSMGALESIRAALPDLPSMLAITAALALYESGRPRMAALMGALGGLMKETGALACALFLKPRKACPALGWDRFVPPLCMLAPAAAWAFYLHATLPQPFAGTENFSIPFYAPISSFGNACNQMISGNFDSGRFPGHVLATLAFLVQFTFFCLVRRPENAWWRVGASFAILFLFLGPFVWKGYWAVARNILPMTIAFNVLLPKNRFFWPLLSLGSLPTLHGLFRLMF